MANNPTLQNAALMGGASVATGRWLSSGAQADYIDIRNQLLLFAASVDAAIPTTTVSAEDAELMTQICASVISERWPTVTANYSAIATAIAAMWSALRASLIPPTPAGAVNQISWQDDFDYVGGGTIATSQVAITLGGLTNWRAISTGATGTIQPANPTGEAGHPGILQITTNGAAVNRAVHMYRGQNAVNGGFTLANQFKQQEFITRLPSSANVALMLGMANNLRGSQTSQMALLYNSSVSANYQFACSKAGVGTTTRDLTGLVPDAGFHRWKIAQDVLGTATLSFDGSVVATIADANVPTTELLNYIFGLETLAVAAKTLDIDWCSYLSQDLGARSP